MGIETTTFMRRVIPVVLCNGADVNNLSESLNSLTYTDNASGTIDDIRLEITNRNRIWESWNPQKEDDLDVTLHSVNWGGNGEMRKYHCGNFTLDDIQYRGGSNTLSIGGVSQPASSNFKGGRITRTWKKITVKQLAMTIMAKYGMGRLHYNAPEYQIDTLEQDDQSDAEFLQTVCDNYGLSMKIYKKALVIFDESWFENGGTVLTIYPWMIEPEYEWTSTLQGTYTGARISYTDGKKGKDITITVGSADRLLYLNEKADSEAEARIKAQSAVNNANKKAVTMSFTLTLADPAIVATACVKLVDFPARINGKYYIEQVVTTLNSSGYTMRVTARKVMGRI